MGRATTWSRSARGSATRRSIALGRAGQRVPAGAAHPRPLRPPHRRGRLPPGLPRADDPRGRPTGCTPRPWARQPPGRARRARGEVRAVDPGRGRHLCPISMTYCRRAGAARRSPTSPPSGSRACSRRPTTRAASRCRPSAARLVGMAHDREAGRLGRAGQHHRGDADRRGGPGGEYSLTGHKWFCSAPMCDAFLMLGAGTDGGLSCFLPCRGGGPTARATRSSSSG